MTLARALVIVLSSFSALGAGCASPGAGDTAQAPAPRDPLAALRTHTTNALSGPPLVTPYPPGRWRLAQSEALASVVLWTSHILVRHAAVTPGVVSFNLGDWVPSPSPPQRTRQEALQIAEAALQRLQQKPSAFGELARELSEDVTTRDYAGSLGGICASELYRRHAEVLDVLSALRPGEFSRVVETVYGFHIFLLRPPPPEQTVSGSRIVIGYNEAPWLDAFLARRAVPFRPRSEALELAQSVYARALQGEPFASLVEQYSDHGEAVRGGDFGEWSTRQCTPFPRELEALSRLAIGEVAPPMDTAFGVQIIRRTENRPRQVYAMTTLQQRFDFAQPKSDPASREAVLENMRRLSRELSTGVSRFELLQKDYCCANVDQWREGHGPPAAEQALARSSFGQIASEPVDIGASYAIVKRVPPEPEPETAFAFELPAPARPDLAYLAREGLFNHQLERAAPLAAAALGLRDEIAKQLVAMLVAESTAAHELEDQRAARFVAFSRDVEGLLGPELYARYLVFMEQFFERVLLAPSRS